MRVAGRVLLRLELLAAAFVLAGCAAGCGDAAGAPAATAESAATSPAKKAGTTATMLVHYPAGYGHRITLHCGGSGKSWDAPIEATWTTGDVWRATVDAPAGTSCKPLYDDATWAIGPNWGIAAGQTLDMWPFFFHDHGAIQRIDGWHSNVLNNDRGIWIYTPPSYDENAAERYPVVYMHDGQNLFYDEASFAGVSWNVGGAMDQGARDGSIHEAIVIGIESGADRMSELTPVADPDDGGGNGDAYLRFVVEELKAQIDGRMRTFPDAQHTAMAGSSLGGLISVYAGFARQGTFGAVAALSPSTWWDNTWLLGASSSAGGQLPSRIYVDSGDSGTSNDDVTNTSKLADVWRTKQGVTVDYLVQHGGQHNETYWRQRVPGALAFVLGGR